MFNLELMPILPSPSPMWQKLHYGALLWADTAKKTEAFSLQLPV